MHTEMIHSGNSNIYVAISGNLEKPAIIFMHGSSESGKIWHHQINDIRLSEKYRLICIDLPGHGNSDRATNPDREYSLNFMAELIQQVITILNVKEHIFVAFSLSTNIIGETRQFLPTCKGLFMAAASIVNRNTPIDKLFLPFQYGHILTSPDPDDQEIENYLKGSTFKKADFDLNLLLTDFKNTDPNCRKALDNIFINVEWGDEINNLKKLNLPISFVFGENEELINIRYQSKVLSKIWHIHTLPNSGHLVQIDQPQAFNDLLMDFAQQCLG